MRDVWPLLPLSLPFSVWLNLQSACSAEAHWQRPYPHPTYTFAIYFEQIGSLESAEYAIKNDLQYIFAHFLLFLLLAIFQIDLHHVVHEQYTFDACTTESKNLHTLVYS